jgi:hypothetical protein
MANRSKGLFQILTIFLITFAIFIINTCSTIFAATYAVSQIAKAKVACYPSDPTPEVYYIFIVHRRLCIMS